MTNLDGFMIKKEKNKNKNKKKKKKKENEKSQIQNIAGWQNFMPGGKGLNRRVGYKASRSDRKES